MLHTEGKHGWGSASMPATTWGDAGHCVKIAYRIAEEFEKAGIIGDLWHVPAERAGYAPHTAGSGLIREPLGSKSTPITSQGWAYIEIADGGEIKIHVGKEFVWVEFPKTEPDTYVVNGREYTDMHPVRHSMRFPREVFP